MPEIAMKRTLAFVLWIAWPHLSAAQEIAKTSEDLFRALAPDAVVDLVQADRQLIPGRIVSVSPSNVAIETAGGVRQLPMTEVSEIWQFKRHSHRKAMFIGSAIGAALILSAKADQGDCNDPKSLCAIDGPVTASDYVGGAAFGAAVGALASFVGRRRVLIYSVDTVPQEPLVPNRADLTPPPAAWTAMASSLAPGTDVAVDTLGRRLHATVKTVGASSMTLEMQGRNYVVMRDAISRVTTRKTSRWWVAGAPVVGAIDGATAFALFALPFCMVHYGDEEKQDKCGKTAAGIGAGIGAAGYTVLAWLASRAHVLYEAAPRQHVEPIVARTAVGIRYVRQLK